MGVYSPNQIINGIPNMGPTIYDGPATPGSTGQSTSSTGGTSSAGAANNMAYGSYGNTTSSSTILPSWISQASQDAIGKAKDITYTPYTGDRVAGTTADQTKAYGGINTLYDNAATSNAANMAQSGIYGYATADPSSVSTSRIIDESGPLGAISSYMNPYIGATLDPTLKAIYDSAAKQRNTIGSSATASGAFGDARQGVLESTLGRNTSEAVGGAVNSAYSNAFDRAMGYRSSDLDRFLTADTTNASLREAGLNRLLTGSQAFQASATQEQQDALDRLNALLASGTAQQQQQQNYADAGLAAHTEAQQAQYDQLNALIAAASGIPTMSTTNTTRPEQSSNSNSTLSTIASIIGAIV